MKGEAEYMVLVDRHRKITARLRELDKIKHPTKNEKDEATELRKVFDLLAPLLRHTHQRIQAVEAHIKAKERVKKQVRILKGEQMTRKEHEDCILPI